MDAEAIRSLLQVLQSTDVDFDDEHLKLLRNTCCVLEAMTAERHRSIVIMAGNRPRLQMFQSDGWSTDIRSRFESRSEGVHVSRICRLRT